MKRQWGDSGVAVDGFFSAKELALILSKYRGREVPDRTLRFWREQLCITPVDGGVYRVESLQLLIRLVSWLERGGTIRGFVSLLLSEKPQETTTIDI